MRARKIVGILAATGAAFVLFTSNATAGTVDVVSDPFIDYIAVDGGSLFYSKRAPNNGGIPITVHRVDLSNGSDVVVRTYTESGLGPVGLAAGGGRLVITENSYPAATTPGNIDVESKVIAMQPDGSAPQELLKQKFPFSPGGYALGALTVKRVTADGEVLIQISDSEKTQNPSKLSLIGIRPDGSRTTYFATDRAPNRQISVSDDYFVWWTLRRVGVAKLEPGGVARVRSTRRGVYSAAVDDNGRLLLTTFLGRGKNSNQLRYFADPQSNRNKLLYSAWKSLAVGQFCGNRLFYARKLAGLDTRQIVETNERGKPIRTLYTAASPVRLGGARDITCDSRHMAWRAIRSSGGASVWDLSVQVANLSD